MATPHPSNNNNSNHKTTPRTDLQGIRNTSTTLKLIQNGKMGTAIIVELVSNSEVRIADLSVMRSIEASIYTKFAAKGVLDRDLIHWSLAAALAAYTLGQTDPFSKHFKNEDENEDEQDKTANKN